MKSNGIPTYNFAVVVDDHLMDITHVLRGEEHLSNTPKQIAIYEMLNWEPPQFGHMTIIVNENGKKLSKRDNNILQFMSQYKKLGYLSQAIFNFILLLGWTPEENKEFFTMEEAIEAFDPKRLSTSPSTFDAKALIFMNSHYIKQLSDQDYLEFIKPHMAKAMDLTRLSDEQILQIALLYKDELGYGEEIVEPLKNIVSPSPIENEEEKALVEKESSLMVFKEFVEQLKSVDQITKDNLKVIFKNVQNKVGVKGKDLYMPIRLKLTGVSHGIELINIINILGKEEVISRIEK